MIEVSEKKVVICRWCHSELRYSYEDVKEKIIECGISWKDGWKFKKYYIECPRCGHTIETYREPYR